MPVTPSVIRWARERAGYDIEFLVRMAWCRDIAAWESGRDSPTYLEVEQLAELFEVPVAVFFFPSPPKLPLIERTFRTIGVDEFGRFPPRLQLLMQRAQHYRGRAADMRTSLGLTERLLVRDLGFSTDDSPDQIAGSLREYLHLSFVDQFSKALKIDPFTQWRNELANVGVTVIVGEFRREDFSGFCLYDTRFPVIYVNDTIRYRCRDIHRRTFLDSLAIRY